MYLGHLWDVWTDICRIASAGPSLVDGASSARGGTAAELPKEHVSHEDLGQFALSSTLEWVLALVIFNNRITLVLNTEQL